MRHMICPLLTYLDMQQAMAELDDLFGLEIVWLAAQPSAFSGRHPLCGHATAGMREPPTPGCLLMEDRHR